MIKEIKFDEEVEFAIEFSKKNEEDNHWLDFKIVECVAYYEDNKPIFNNYDLGSGLDDCIDFEEAYEKNPLCNGYIKWDGCMEIHNLTYHFCGYSNFLQRLTRNIYAGAKKILKENLDDDLAMMKNLEKY